MSNLKTQPGTSYPLGSVFDGKGVNFALFPPSCFKSGIVFVQ